jgi:hypothetical protein
MSIHVNTRGRQLEYICTIGMSKILGAQGYVVTHMEMIKHVCNMNIEL